jgi:type II secretory pathway pseudopilin PulG
MRDRGFILVMLLGLITIMGILLTVALPSVETEIQRDQEAELIFRGEAIANAIRAYKARTGGYPSSLDDLMKVKPRILRKVYLDPMTLNTPHEGEWDLITAVQPGASGDKAGLPIVGVRSFSQKDSKRLYQGKDLVSDWTFSAADNILGLPGGNAAAAAAVLGGNTAGGQPGGVDTANIPQGQTPPTGQQPGGQPPAVQPPTGQPSAGQPGVAQPQPPPQPPADSGSPQPQQPAAPNQPGQPAQPSATGDSGQPGPAGSTANPPGQPASGAQPGNSDQTTAPAPQPPE